MGNLVAAICMLVPMQFSFLVGICGFVLMAKTASGGNLEKRIQRGSSKLVAAGTG